MKEIGFITAISIFLVFIMASTAFCQIEPLPAKRDKEDKVRKCTKIWPTDDGKLLIVNQCSNCKVAVLDWGGKVGVKNYKVEGHSERKVEQPQNRGNVTRRINERPCR